MGAPSIGAPSIGAPPIPHRPKRDNGSSVLAAADGRLGTPMTTTIRSVEHLHDRPDWDCRICKQPWPCANAKIDLLTEFRGFPSVLAVYLFSQMYDALGDLTSHGESPPTDLYERFISWVRVN